MKSTQLTDIPGIGDKTAAALTRAGITTLAELVETYPRTYREYYARSAKEARPTEWVVLKGHLTRPVSRRTARVTTQLSTFQDHSGRLQLRWFNLPYLVCSVRPQATYFVKGQVEQFRGVKQLVTPQLTLVDDATSLEDQLVPIYSQKGSLKPWVLRTKISSALKSATLPPDPLPPFITKEHELLSYHDALRLIHHPTSKRLLEDAIYRLAFQELYFLQLAAIKHKSRRPKLSTPLSINHASINHFVSSLPFKLTPSQQRAVRAITTDLGSASPMRRLLSGEVGSGKTVVAAAAALATHFAGYQTLVMAPTVILAEQLHDSLSHFLTPHGLTLELVTSGSRFDRGANLLVGTHALLNQQLEGVGLVIIDEQHRFGVRARETLSALGLHTLLMTATPIPRTLAQTLFAGLEVTELTELPPGRKKVKTFLVPEHKRADSYTWLKAEIKQGNQAFIVTPLIEKMEEADQSPLKSLRELEASLRRLFPDLTIDVMHGRLKDQQKLASLAAFREGHTDLLVATSMVEVGLDIPNANVIIVEDADRFGLATLHQLRGRVGRGGQAGYCLLFTDNHSPRVTERLKYFTRTGDGAKLALYDLQARGPGELFGQVQHGFFRLKLASLYDQKLLKATHTAATQALSKPVA